MKSSRTKVYHSVGGAPHAETKSDTMRLTITTARSLRSLYAQKNTITVDKCQLGYATNVHLFGKGNLNPPKLIVFCFLFFITLNLNLP